jgi:hypothetical protein
MEVARKELIEYKLNTPYSFKKVYECIGHPVQYENDLMSSLIHYVLNGLLYYLRVFT